MKYEDLEELVLAAKSGEFTGTVTIDNDCVFAYDDDKEVYNFGGALFDALTILGLKVEMA